MSAGEATPRSRMWPSRWNCARCASEIGYGEERSGSVAGSIAIVMGGFLASFSSKVSRFFHENISTVVFAARIAVSCGRWTHRFAGGAGSGGSLPGVFIPRPRTYSATFHSPRVSDRKQTTMKDTTDMDWMEPDWEELDRKANAIIAR